MSHFSTAALLIDAAVRNSKGKLDNKASVRKALEAVTFGTVRGAFGFKTNHYRIQGDCLRASTKEAQVSSTRTLGTVVRNHADASVGACRTAT